MNRLKFIRNYCLKCFFTKIRLFYHSSNVIYNDENQNFAQGVLKEYVHGIPDFIENYFLYHKYFKGIKVVN